MESKEQMLSQIKENETAVRRIGEGIYNADMKKGPQAKQIFTAWASPTMQRLREENKQLNIKIRNL